MQPVHSGKKKPNFLALWSPFTTVNAYEKMKAAGVSAQLHMGEKMCHVFPSWPCPEGKQAREEIAAIILQ